MVYPRHAVTSVGYCCMPKGIPPTLLVVYFPKVPLQFYSQMYTEQLIVAPQNAFYAA